jgi:hypothetical protein
MAKSGSPWKAGPTRKNPSAGRETGGPGEKSRAVEVPKRGKQVLRSLGLPAASWLGMDQVWWYTSGG